MPSNDNQYISCNNTEPVKVQQQQAKRQYRQQMAANRQTTVANITNDPSANHNDSHLNNDRRNSIPVWVPLLENGGGNDHINNETVAKMADEFSDSNEFHNGSASNNNEWIDRNNKMDDTTDVYNGRTPLYKNGNGSQVYCEKFDEENPLTGLYQLKHKKVTESHESVFDPFLDENLRKPNRLNWFDCQQTKCTFNVASTKVFMVVFLLAYVLQGMFMTYFVSVITTIEKLFQIKSKTTGILLSASEMGQISTALLLTYFAGRGHRPRWIACGMVIFSVAAFACSLPHFFFGNELLQSTMILTAKNHLTKADSIDYDLTMKDIDLNTDGFKSPTGLASFESKDELLSRQQQLLIDQHNLNLCQITNATSNNDIDCNEDRKLEQASHSRISIIVLCIFFISLMCSGIGQTAVVTLGIPYIDDNVSSKKSPMYLAITIGIRILGPASGFIVGSLCTRWYVDFSNPGFNASDPRWIGAWWLGPLLIGILMLLGSFAMFSFPRELRKSQTPPAITDVTNEKDSKECNEITEKPKLKDFPKTMRRQLSNDILMFRTASCVFHLLPISGLYIFLPKYLETQFHLAPYDANMIAASCGILIMGVGIVISGIVILKIKPTAKSVAAWIALTALVYSIGMAILMFIGCNMNDFAGYVPATKQTSAIIQPACDAAIDCVCDKKQFAPICGIDGKIYISSCHAGCSLAAIQKTDNQTIAFSNCACIPKSIQNEIEYEALSGYCDSNCKNFLFFICIFVLCVFMHSTSEVGSMLLVMRCTDPKDKALAMGVIQSAIGLFGNVPCPIIYGAVVDSACLLWKSICGEHGACSLYDADSFRHYYLGMTSGIMFLAFIMDLVVWSKAHRIDITPQEDNTNKGNNDLENGTNTNTKTKAMAMAKATVKATTKAKAKAKVKAKASNA